MVVCSPVSPWLFPQVCRTYNFGEVGSSKGQFYNRYLRHIKLNDVDIDWKTMVCENHLLLLLLPPSFRSPPETNLTHG